MDGGKGLHRAAVVLDADGEMLLSRRVENEEADLSALVEEALGFGLESTRAVDQPGGGAVASLLALLLCWERGTSGFSLRAGDRRGPRPRRLPPGRVKRPTPATPASSPSRPA